MKFTLDQQRVIDTRNKNILVSAAAGSGKTAVLVERILARITDPEAPLDIDRLLVVTFTNAAAAGMKERISRAIEERLSLEPGNAHLQRQSVLVHQALITTMHSFCLYLIRNHFEAIGLEPDFTVADDAAIRLLSGEVRDDVIEEAFQAGDEDFLFLVEYICHNGREESLEEYMLQLYDRAMSMPFPKAWLLQRKADYDFTDLLSFTEQESGQYLLHHIKGLLQSYAEAYDLLCRTALEPDGPYMYAELLEKESAYLQRILQYDDLAEMAKWLPNMEFGRLSSKRDPTVHAGKRELVKEKRNAYKDKIRGLAEQFFGKSPQTIAVENEAVRRALGALVDLTIAYMDRLSQAKRRRGVIDFQDMEHMALEILVVQDEDGQARPTEIAESYQALFEEVMVDEYQDSNQVQETIVGAVSSHAPDKHNRFMVGDVKQSIYKFRLARPELFMEKYHSYAAGGQFDVRIDLKKNFRSRKEVLEAANSVFEKVMLPELGGIAYDENAMLYLGAEYPPAPGMEAELLVATNAMPEQFQPKEWEAYCTAARIKELVKSGMVTDEETKTLRPVCYRDIVLLFRSPAQYEEAYRKVFEAEGIPLYILSGSGYFDTLEVQNLEKLLQAIENPMQDIPLYGVCISLFGGMTEEQLAEVRVHYQTYLKEEAKQTAFRYGLYDMLKQYEKDCPGELTAKKITQIFAMLDEYRKKARYLTAAELLRSVIRDFRYREHMQVMADGEKRIANVDLLLQKAEAYGKDGNQSLFAFTAYMNQLHKQSVDYGEANSLTEQADVVRVMSIHKSKGLEFPVVIVGGMGSSYQMRDKQQMLLIDNDMGLGLDYINTSLRSRNRTLRKNVIAWKMEQEILAEEQRIFYVAMTRAKEKLIMIGYCKDFSIEALQEKPAVRTDSGTCLLSDILSVRSYLDMCLLAWEENSPIRLRSMDISDYAETEVVQSMDRTERRELLYRLLDLNRTEPKDDMMPKDGMEPEDDMTSGDGMEPEEGAEQKDDMTSGDGMEPEDSLAAFYHEERGSIAAIRSAAKAYEKPLDYRYPDWKLRDLYAKTSVSELKHQAMREELEAVQELFEKEEEAALHPYIPSFIQEKEEIKGAERGTAYHRVMELLDFSDPPQGAKEWKEALEQMTASGRLTERQKSCIYIPKMQAFISSDIGRRMQKAGRAHKLFKEQSFFLGVPADTLDQDFPAEETVLIQGIIDAYFEEDGALVLVDYKTDHIEKGAELTERYHTQMEYYVKALEQALQKKVKDVILYSLALNEEVPGLRKGKGTETEEAAL